MVFRFWWISTALLFWSSLASGAERLALVIGNDRYSHLQPLMQAAADAKRVGDALQSLPDSFEVTRASDLDRVSFVRALAGFQRQLAEHGQHGGEVALVYYAGHAVNHANQVWLLPVDASIETPEDIEAVGVPLRDVGAKLRVGGWKAVVLILDACRNSLFAGDLHTQGIRGDILPRGLPPIPRVEGLLLAYATAEGMVAKEDPVTGGYYTRELIAHIVQPGLKLQDVFINTALAVKKHTGQEPELNVTAIEPVYLAGGHPSFETIQPADPDRQLWDESQCNSNDRAGCEAYLASYPQGRFSALAKQRLAASAPQISPNRRDLGDPMDSLDWDYPSSGFIWTRGEKHNEFKLLIELTNESSTSAIRYTLRLSTGYFRDCVPNSLNFVHERFVEAKGVIDPGETRPVVFSSQVIAKQGFFTPKCGGVDPRYNEALQWRHSGRDYRHLVFHEVEWAQ